MRTTRLTLALLLTVLLSACQRGPTAATPPDAPAPAPTALTPAQQHGLDGQLILATYALDLPEVERLLAAGANPNARAGEMEAPWNNLIGSTHWTPLLACMHGQGATDRYPICIALLDAGADIDAADDHGATALYKAINRCNTEIALMLIRLGADFDTRTEVYIDAPQGTPLWMAVYRGEHAVVRALIREGVDPNGGPDERGLPLILAVRLGDEKMVIELVEAGADVNVTRVEYGIDWEDEDVDLVYDVPVLLLALRQGAEHKFDDAIDALEAAGATLGDPARINDLEAFRHLLNDHRLVRRLLDHGVLPVSADDFGNTILHEAAREPQAYLALRELLKVDGIAVDARNEDGYTPLTDALEIFRRPHGSLDNASLLLEAGADPDLLLPGGGTHLHSAVYSGSIGGVALLLAYGANPTILNDDGDSPLDAALASNNDKAALAAALLRAAVEAWEGRGE